jgi:superfamily II DNA or RNA helicase
MKKTTTKAAGGRGSRIFSAEDCCAIAKTYDGTTACLDALLRVWRRKRRGVNRHNLAVAARRGGYAPSSPRRAWRQDEDAFLSRSWHEMSAEEVAKALGRSVHSVNMRRKALGIGRYDGEDLTIRQLEALTKLDHRQWQEHVERGWLRVRRRARCNDAAPVSYVSLGSLHRLLEEHPEVYDYQSAALDVRALLELERLAAPPAWKRVVCRSTSWSDGARLMPLGRQATHEAATLVSREQRFTMRSCAEEGGVGFWAPTYALPSCPRCGCQVSRYSEEGLFTDLPPGDDEVIDIQARKLGLRWAAGELRTPEGHLVKDGDVMRYLFGGGRRSARSIATFDRLLQAGLGAVHCGPVDRDALLPHILDFDLRPDQEAVLDEWVRTGALTAAQAMSFGKSVVGMTILTRLAGRHLLVVDTQMNREQWIERLVCHAPRVEVRRCRRPTMVEITVFERDGRQRCSIEIYTYMIRATLDGEWVLGCFDEVHRLPAAMAHRLALVPTRYRLGLSATADMREDGRGALVSKMTGPMVGEDWTEQMRSGVVSRIPVHVMIVEDREHKHEVVGELLRRHGRVAVLCEALEDGRELELRYGIPFIHGTTKNKLQVLRQARSVVLSRVGDAAISMPHCEVTIDHSGLFGSRIQSLQRLGRLMHSDRAQYHCILMTHSERHERFAKRVEAIKAKGFDVTEAVARRQRATVHRLLPPALEGRVSAQDNPLLAALGWRKSDLVGVG